MMPTWCRWLYRVFHVYANSNVFLLPQPLVSLSNIPQVFHLECCDPPLTEVPEGDFVCPRCVDESHKDECETCGKGSTEEDGDLLMCDTEDCPFVSGCTEQYQHEQKNVCPW